MAGESHTSGVLRLYAVYGPYLAYYCQCHSLLLLTSSRSRALSRPPVNLRVCPYTCCCCLTSIITLHHQILLASCLLTAPLFSSLRCTTCTMMAEVLSSASSAAGALIDARVVKGTKRQYGNKMEHLE